MTASWFRVVALVPLLLLIALPRVASAVGSVHTSDKQHDAVAMVWTENTVWLGGPPSAAGPADADLDFDWVWSSPTELAAAGAMATFAVKDLAGNPLAMHDETSLLSGHTHFTRSVTGMPASFDITVLSHDFAGDTYSVILDSLFTTTVIRVGLAPDPSGLMLATYQGRIPAGTTYLVQDDVLGSTAVSVESDGTGTFEISLLSSVPEPASVVTLALAILAVGLWRRRS